MINIHSNKTLNIIVPNTNKALHEVLQNITPDEFKTLSAHKDLKSILDSLLTQSAKQATSDKTLLNLAKSNPTLKELGNVHTTIKELLNTLSKENNTLQLEKQLKTFLSDIKDMSEKGLQTKIQNSGLFLENKIKNLQTPQAILQNALSELTHMLESSKLPNVKLLNTQLKELLASDAFKNISNEVLLKNTIIDLTLVSQATKELQTLSSKLLQSMHSAVDKSLHPNDVLFSKELKGVLSQLQQISKNALLQPQTQAKEMFSHDLKAILLQAHDEITAASSPNKADLLKGIDKLTLQIDYQQLLSHLNNATSLFIPYSWDALEEGELQIKKIKENKFFTDIKLQLKEFGELHLRLGMFETNQLNINIRAQSEELQHILKENISQLKKQLIDVGITPATIRFLDDKDSLTSGYAQNDGDFNTGFEVKA